MLTRESFLSGPKPESAVVDVPALGGQVHVKQMTIGERDRFEMANAKDKGRYFRPRLVAATAVASDGSPIFNRDDFQHLANLASHVVEPIVQAALTLNRYTAKEVEELAGN